MTSLIDKNSKHILEGFGEGISDSIWNLVWQKENYNKWILCENNESGRKKLKLLMHFLINSIMKKNEIDAVLKAQKLCDYAKNDSKLYYAEIEKKIDGLTASIMCYRLFPFKVKILELYMMYRNFEDFDIELCIDQVRDSIQTV